MQTTEMEDEVVGEVEVNRDIGDVTATTTVTPSRRCGDDDGDGEEETVPRDETGIQSDADLSHESLKLPDQLFSERDEGKL